MLPDSLIIRCPDVEDIEPLFQFLESEGVVWGDLRSPLSTVRINFQAYAESKQEVVCLDLERGRLGYCRESWYRSHAPYSRFPFIDAKELLGADVEEETITGLANLL